MKLTIDHQVLELDTPVSIYHAAEKVGIRIPVMCYKPGQGHITSCMICMVKEKVTGRMLPACSAPATEGMDIETDSEEIRIFRKSTLELLLSDHVGDCEGPCQRLCSVHSDIPRMIRAIRAGNMEEAISVVREEMAIPSILERCCTAPCEKGCRRSKHDEGLSIRHLTRFVADWDLGRPEPFTPAPKPATGKRVAVIGAGAAGLSAAYFAALAGHTCSVYEKSSRPGGRLYAEFKADQWPDWVITGELRVLENLGVQFRFNTDVTASELNHIQGAVDALIYAGGASPAAELETLGLNSKAGSASGITSVQSVFLAGSVLKARQPIAKSILGGKNAAALVTQYLSNQPMTGLADVYNHTMGRLLDGELEIFLKHASPERQVKPADLEGRGFDPTEAQRETTRCLHCDCRKNRNCKLRAFSDLYKAEQGAFKSEERARHVHIDQNCSVLYEPEKCIKCGLCVRISEREQERFGFAFVSRGFKVRPGIALKKGLAEGLNKIASEVVEACPTGALATRDA